MSFLLLNLNLWLYADGARRRRHAVESTTESWDVGMESTTESWDVEVESTTNESDLLATTDALNDTDQIKEGVDSINDDAESGGMWSSIDMVRLE